jgi:hypothetical protein
MLQMKNLLFQPLTLHLADSNKSIHLASRGTTTIKDKELSQEIKRAQAKGWISIKEEKQPEPITKGNRRAKS